MTRGNGLEGERVLHSIRNTNVPDAIPFYGELKIRCEAVIPKDKFNQLKEDIAERNGKIPATARNLVAGTVRCLNTDVTRERGVELHAFELVSIKGYCSYRIFQLPIEHTLCFRSLEEWTDHKTYPKAEEYKLVYQGISETSIDMDDANNHYIFLDNLYTELNVSHPKEYKTRSLSVSDVVVVDYDTAGKNKSVAYFVDGVGYKKVSFECDPLVYPFSSNYQERKYLETLGFSCIPYMLLHSEEEVRKYVSDVTSLREMDALDYDIDGIVFSIDSNDRKRALGNTSKFPLSSMALKFPNKGKISRVAEITWQVGMFGNLTPVITIDPPLDFNGVTISKATAHNLNFLLGKSDKGEIVRPPIKADGSTEVFIERGGEVIPKITEVYYDAEAVELNNSLEELYPKICPVCGAPTEINGVDLRCTNPNCAGKLKAKLRNMVSRNCLNLEGFGEKTIDMLVDQGFIKCIQDLFSLRDYKNEIINLEGYGIKKVEKLLKEVKSASTVPLHNVIASLCLPGVGLETARSLVPVLTNGLIDILTVKEETLKAIDGIGEKTAKNIVEFVAEPNNIVYCYLYYELGMPTIHKDEEQGMSLIGKTFVVTGSLFDERSIVEALIRKNSGKVTSSVTGKTDYLVVGENPGNSKMTDADKHNVIKITGDELLEMIQG